LTFTVATAGLAIAALDIAVNRRSTGSNLYWA
jgi:hypothetical protein